MTDCIRVCWLPAALTVRFLTKRYIGEYDHHGDQPPYKYELMVDAEPVLFELLDTCAKVSTGQVATFLELM